MSTSIAALPAYKTTKATRTKARADRTIFGTTLDNSPKAEQLLQSEGAQSAAEQLFENRHKTWKTPTPTKQVLIDGAWGVKDYTQPEIGEEYTRGYSRVSAYSDVSSVEIYSPVESENESPKLSARENKKPQTPLIAYKDRHGVFNVLTDSNDKRDEFDRNKPSEHILLKPGSENQHNARPYKQRTRLPVERRRRISRMSSQRSSVDGAKQTRKQSTISRNKISVPKYYFPHSGRNPLRTASLKITETGAKDLINAKPINKVGLGETLQYNHESFKKPQCPKQYRDLGNVFSLGQRGHSVTTNREVTGPGGFYEITTPEMPNGRDSNKSDRGSVYAMPYQPIITSRRTYDAARKKRPPAPTNHTSVPTPARLDDVIPLNIIHKFGEEDVKRLLSGNEREVKYALEEARKSNLSHTGVVPPRIDVPELNHPIDPSPAYHRNFGQSLKYDKFEGGLHLYIN